MLRIIAPDFAIVSIDADLLPPPDPGIPTIPITAASIKQLHEKQADGTWKNVVDVMSPESFQNN